MYESVDTLCVLVGNRQGGRALVANILDAHPEAVVAPGADVVATLVQQDPASWDREAVIGALVRESEERQAARGEPDPSQPFQAANHSGRFTELHLVGITRGERIIDGWRRDPELLHQMAERLGVTVRVVHVYRNPWDQIALLMPREGEKTIGRYFARANAIAQLKEAAPVAVHDIRLESLRRDADREIPALTEFLGLSSPTAYVARWDHLLLRSGRQPAEPRKSQEWTRRQALSIRRRVAKFPWLEPYVTRASG
jgi:hypothetical protein